MRSGTETNDFPPETAAKSIGVTVITKLPIEVKSGSDFRRHAALDNMMGIPDYGLVQAAVYTAHNEIGGDRVSYQPIYALMFLEHDSLPKDAVYRLDV